MKTRMKRAMKDERCWINSSASHGSNWKRHELSSISRQLPYSLWRHPQARSETTFATWLYSQVAFGPTRSEKLASSEEARQWKRRKADCFGASAFVKSGGSRDSFQDSDPFDFLAPETMTQDVQQLLLFCSESQDQDDVGRRPVRTSRNSVQPRQYRLQSGIKDTSRDVSVRHWRKKSSLRRTNFKHSSIGPRCSEARGTYGRKAARAKTFRTRIPTVDGQYTSRELLDPEIFEAWLAS